MTAWDVLCADGTSWRRYSDPGELSTAAVVCPCFQICGLGRDVHVNRQSKLLLNAGSSSLLLFFSRLSFFFKKSERGLVYSSESFLRGRVPSHVSRRSQEPTRAMVIVVRTIAISSAIAHLNTTETSKKFSYSYKLPAQKTYNQVSLAREKGYRWPLQKDVPPGLKTYQDLHLWIEPTFIHSVPVIQQYSIARDDVDRQETRQTQ